MSGFTEYRTGELVLLRSPLFEREGISHAFTTRLGGVSGGALESLNLRPSVDSPENIAENLRRVAEVVGFSPERCAATRQVHGAEVRVVAQDEPAFSPARPDCDGVVCRLRGHALMSFGADCVTVLISDRRTGAAAAVHAGWRGAVAGTVTRAVETMSREFGSRPEEMIAAIGPAISGERYEVGEEVAQALIGACGEEDALAIMPRRGEKFYPDLRAFAALRLRRAGVGVTSIDLDTHCTYSEPEMFWSHRRTGDARGVQAAIIVVK